jgi:hypothetical protein
VNDLGAVDKVQSMQYLVGQILDVGNWKTSSRHVEKEFQSNTERRVNEKMVVAVALTKLKVIQCLPNVLFSGRIADFSRFGYNFVRVYLALNGGVVANHGLHADVFIATTQWDSAIIK